MLSEDINWIARTLKHHLQEDGQIRILEKEAQGFIANLNTCARRVKVLERRPIATDAPRDTAVHAGTGRKPMQGGEQGAVGTPMRSGRRARSLCRLRRTSRRGSAFTERALGQGRVAPCGPKSWTWSAVRCGILCVREADTETARMEGLRRSRPRPRRNSRRRKRAMAGVWWRSRESFEVC